ncbi:guanine nucleotide-binding protein subunit gamma 2-like isoform X2 [Humulus lupulus]|uniref:guanine nucleotide-binding protein subunit gamma 2-like isoform X2 n=1 Tax=Humulus lupulus TaxID=3486 RepID=UPI002B4151ED|nr:guanine nucleotide-binding protein subunit gamma 2-like isoform X2 [Humulus lupulus]
MSNAVVAMDSEKQPPNPPSLQPPPSWPVRGERDGDGERGKEEEEVAQSSSHQEHNKAEVTKLKINHTFLGRHRMNAAISHLNTQINLIQEELNELDTVGESSIVCAETKGPADVSWDRWFRKAHISRGHKRWK